MDGVLAFVAAGLGAAVVPAIAMPAEQQVDRHPLQPRDLSRTVALAQRNDRALARPAGPWPTSSPLHHGGATRVDRPRRRRPR